MKKLLVKIGIIGVAFVVLDLVVGSFLLSLLENSPDGRYYKTRYTLEESNEEVLILGSSRAEGNYAPAVMEESLNMEVWNAGRGGQGLPFWAALNRGVLSRHTPDVVLINIENDFLKYYPDNQSYERAAGILRPFYKRHTAVRDFVDRVSGSEKLLLNSNLYAFNSSFYYMMRPYFFKGIDGRMEDKGWKPLEGKIKGNSVKERIIHEEDMNTLDPESVEIFTNLVEDLQRQGSLVVVAISPDFNKRVIDTPSLRYVRKMKDVHVLDFANDEEFTKNPDYYTDPIHLNKHGAKAYSKKVAHKLQELMASKPDINLAEQVVEKSTLDLR